MIFLDLLFATLIVLGVGALVNFIAELITKK